MTFGRYLSAQKVRDDWIGDLARAAVKDPRFPWSGEPLDMQARIRAAMGSDCAESLHALQAALDEWNEGHYSLAADDQARREARKQAARRDYEAQVAAQEKRDRRNERRRELYRERRDQRLAR